MLEILDIIKGNGGRTHQVCDMSFLKNPTKIVKTTGIESVNILTRDELLTSFIDLIDDNLSLLDSCELLIVVNQTKPFELPQVSNFILEKVGYKGQMECIDLTLGCTGFVYATTLADRLLAKGENCIILTGDAISTQIDVDDSVNRPLFGDQTFLTYFKKNSDLVHHLNTNLFKGSHNLYLNGNDSTHLEESGFKMNGMEIFNFGLHEVTNAIKSYAQFHKITDKNIILHQANKFMLKSIMAKIREYNLNDFYNDGKIGNTGPSTIPDTIHNNKLDLVGQECIIVGFGVGLQISINIIKL